MSSPEYIASLNELQTQLIKLSSSFSSIQGQVIQDILPLLDLQSRVSKTFEPFLKSLESCRSTMATLDPSILAAFNRQQGILSDLYNVDFDVSSTYVSYETSTAFTQISLDIMSELECQTCNEITLETQKASLEISKHKKHLTLEQVFAIITVIINLISFIQSQMPNVQLNNIENDLHQLIEIQNDELSLLKASIPEQSQTK